MKDITITVLIQTNTSHKQTIYINNSEYAF